MSVIALMHMVAEMEKKLRELMGDEEYRKFAAKVAKEAREEEICAPKRIVGEDDD